jgi:hypothetical protein
MIGTLSGNMIIHRMIDKLNQKPEAPRISHDGFWYGKLQRFVTDYRSLYPVGQLHSCFWISITLLFAGFIGVVVCLMVPFQ